MSTDVHQFMTGIGSEKCVVKRFRRCANVIECTDTNLDTIAYYTPSMYVCMCVCVCIYIYRVSQEECARLREGVPYA